MNALNPVTSRVALPSFGESVSKVLTAIKDAVVKVALGAWSYIKAGASWLQSAYAAHPQRFIVGGIAFAAGALIAAIWCSCRNRQQQPPVPAVPAQTAGATPGATVNVTTSPNTTAGTPAATTTSISLNPPQATPQPTPRQFYEVVNGQLVPAPRT